MKRVVWLILIAFGTALAQVQPVLPVQTQIGECCCCTDASAGACTHDTAKGMEDCMPCGPVCGPAFVTLLPATAIAVAANPAEVSRLNWLAETGTMRADPPLLTPPRAAV